MHAEISYVHTWEGVDNLYIRGIHNHEYLSIDVTSSDGVELCGVPGGMVLGVPGRGYAGFWI